MNERQHVKGFDTLKGLAVLIAVTIGHYWQFTPGGYYADGASTFWVGLTNKITQYSFSISYTFMELLLMISGFQLFKYYDIINSDQITFADYFKRRFKRLVPMAAVTAILMFVGAACYYRRFGEYWYNVAPSPGYLIENIFLIQSWVNNFHTLNGPMWYVSVYFFCTILFYFLARIDKRHGGMFFMAIPVLLGIWLQGHNSTLLLLNNDMYRGYIAFFIGILAAYACSKIPDKYLVWYVPISIISFVAVYKLGHDFFANNDPVSKVIATLVLLYAPILMALTRWTRLDNIVGNPGISWLGKISYELCAINFPFYLWLEIANRKFNWQIPYGRVPMYYVLAAIQILLALILYWGRTWSKQKVQEGRTSEQL